MKVLLDSVQQFNCVAIGKPQPERFKLDQKNNENKQTKDRCVCCTGDFLRTTKPLMVHVRTPLKYASSQRNCLTIIVLENKMSHSPPS